MFIALLTLTLVTIATFMFKAVIGAAGFRHSRCSDATEYYYEEKIFYTDSGTYGYTAVCSSYDFE